MRTIYLIIIFLCFLLTVNAQSIIEGRIVSENGSPLSNVSITISKIKSTAIISFDISGTNGRYRITVNSKEDSFFLKASLLGYEFSERLVINKSGQQDFKLVLSSESLKNVVVKNSPVRQSKDTLSYSVQSFSAKEDRTIADVIKRMPGIEVTEDGKILYQGSAIQAFLVNGLDLLEGKYSLATNNLPHNAVKDVQIIENDQRIKILDSLVFSNKTTLNIKLKRYLTTGIANIAVGGTPLLWDINITPIIFNKKFQAIGSYQANNTGTDLSKQLQTLTNDNPFEVINKNSVSILSADQLATPSFDPQFWLNNNQHLFSSNVLQVLQKDLQLKFNTSYVTDIQHQYGSSSTTYTVPGQIILIDEVKQNSYNKNELKSGLVIEKNTKNILLKENISYEKVWNNANTFLQNGIQNIDETLKGDPYFLTNKLNLIKAIGKQLINLNSLISIRTLPQALQVKPGQYDSIFNNNKSYDQVTQILKLTTFHTDNYVGFVKAIRKFTLSPKVGLEIQKQSFESSISTFTSLVKTDLGSSFRNNLSLAKTNVYEELNLQFKSNDLVSILLMKISQQSYSLNNNKLQNRTSIARVLYEPKFSLRLKPTEKFEISIYSSVDNIFGEISQLYNAYILQSYRSLRRLNTTLPESLSFTNSISMNYKDPLKGFFYSAGYSISKAWKNLIYSNIINPDGSTTLESILLDNSQKYFSFNGSVGKYIKEIKTVVKLNGRLGRNNSEQLLNNIINAIKSNTSGWGINFANTTFKHISIGYDANFSYSSNRLNEKEISNVNLQDHNVRISFSPVTSQMISLTTKYYYNNQIGNSNQAFVNLLYRYSISKRKIDFELSCNNLLNSQFYATAFSDGFITVTNSFKIRERQVLASVRFSF